MTAAIDDERRASGHGWRLLGWSAAGALLLTPAVAMRFTDEVRWTAADFVFAAVMLLVAGGALELLVRAGPGRAYRAGSGVAVLAALMLVWVNAAVGIIGSEANDANLLYAGLIVVVMGGAAVVRGRAGGMVGVTVTAAVAQAGIGAAAVLLRLGSEAPVWPRDVLGASALFTVLWLVAAALFAMAARRGR